MAMYRILIVDDSAFMRKLFSDIIAADPAFTVCGTAKTGAEAVAQLDELKPDAITMDLEMPEMNGLEALKIVMAKCPTPVIMLSGISEQNTRETIAALQLGAFDFIRKPTAAQVDVAQVAEELLLRLKTAVAVKRAQALRTPPPPPQAPAAAPAKPAGRPAPGGEERRAGADAAPPREPRRQPSPEASGGSGAAGVAAAGAAEAADGARPAAQGRAGRAPSAARAERPADGAPKPAAEADRPFRHLIAIGTSTGGPRALHQLLSSLPGSLSAPVVVVQHMPPKFTRSLAQRLDAFSELSVKEAAHGDRLTAGSVYISPGGYHMRVARRGDGYYIELSQDSPRSGHRPSVDVLFESLVPHKELARHAVIMTGMGSDGAAGMKALADGGAASTIAEAEETCIVFGMPRSAIEGGAVQTVLPLHEIATGLVAAVTKPT